tara:strand:- start:11934 stop:12257 length:324 start_codon:yes stop_codon:yes gene_type:complete
MAYNDSGEKYPSYGMALNNLRPGTRWIIYNNDLSTLEWQDEGGPPTTAEINQELNRLKSDYAARNYSRMRADEYPEIHVQLDMIYHDIDNWRAEINKIKEKYPKPEA